MKFPSMRRWRRLTTTSVMECIARRSIAAASHTNRILSQAVVPFQAGAAGFTSFPEPLVGDQVRGKPERFADHYTQATLFWNSQTDVEKAHIIRAFRFELSRAQIPAVRSASLPCWQTSQMILPQA